MAKGKGKRIGLWIIAGLLFVGLIGFGSAGFNGGIRTIGTVGDKDIAVSDYANGLSQQLDAFSAQFGTQISFAQAEQFGLPQSVLSQMIANRGLDNEATNMGLSVGDERVFQQVTQIQAFAGIDGSFDRDAYSFALDRINKTEQQFETGLREDVARSLLQTAVIGGTSDPEIYADAMVAYIGQQRSITWATLDANALGSDIPEPTEAAITAHYEANPESYTSPETRQISYAWVTPEMLRDQVEVDETALQNLYDERIDEFVQPERRLVERLIYPDEEAAEAAMAAITAGDTGFDALVEARGLELEDVDLGDVDRDELSTAADAVFAAEPGAVVGPVETNLGPALFRMNAVLSAQEISFEDARENLGNELASERARRIITDMRDQINDYLAGGASVEDLSDLTELVSESIDWSQNSSDGIAAYEAFRQSAPLLEEGTFPEVVELSDGGIFIARLDGVIAPALLPLDEVRDQATEDRHAAARQEAVIAQTEELVAALSLDGDFVELGLEPNVQEGLIRRDFIAGTPEDFIEQVFEMQNGDVLRMPTDDGAVIVRLDAIAPADLEDPTMIAEHEALVQRAGAGIAQDIYGIYLGQVQLRTDVRINEAAINQIHSQFR